MSKDKFIMFFSIFLMILLLGAMLSAVYKINDTMSETNNVKYTEVITPIYIDNNGAILSSDEKIYRIISNARYASGKNFMINKYKINEAIRTNKSVELTIQTICLPITGCEDAVSSVKYI